MLCCILFYFSNNICCVNLKHIWWNGWTHIFLCRFDIICGIFWWPRGTCLRRPPCPKRPPTTFSELVIIPSMCQCLIHLWRHDFSCVELGCIRQSPVQPVPTRHRLHACIKMRSALPANTKTWPNVVSMLVQRRWRWANSETALGQILAFAGLHTVVCLHPPLHHHNILASRSGYF